jgi:hypothetical protein
LEGKIQKFFNPTFFTMPENGKKILWRPAENSLFAMGHAQRHATAEGRRKKPGEGAGGEA